jgi:hypothetical protein
MAAKKRSTGKIKGDLVHVHGYIPKDLYAALSRSAEAVGEEVGLKGWESRTLRRALREFVENHPARGPLRRAAEPA